MKMRIAAPALAAGALFAILSGTPVQAADSKDAAPPVGAEPQTTSATYGDWTLHCARGPDGVQVCELDQPFQMQGQQGLYAQLIIARGTAKGSYRALFEVAPNLSFPSTVKVGVDDKDPTPIDLTWRRCLPGPGCFADADVKDDIVKKWRTQAGPGRITFKDSAGHDVQVAFSFRGLPQALDALVKD
jgi:invasion protein IalB